MTISVLITARNGSARFPDKCLSMFGNLTIIEHLLTRCEYFGLNPIICTSSSTKDNSIVEIANNYGVSFFRGSELNKIDRWKTCMNHFGLESAHILDADDPFFDPIEIRSSYELLLNSSFEVILSSNRSESGFASVGKSVSISALETILQLAKIKEITEFDTIPWKNFLPIDKISVLPDNNVSDIPELRLTLDYFEDLTLLQKIYHEFGSKVSRRDIENFLIKRPDWIAINLHRNKDFSERQKKQIDNINELYFPVP
jgi:spore coat polysaccharide biosynthesis protein SpsF